MVPRWLCGASCVGKVGQRAAHTSHLEPDNVCSCLIYIASDTRNSGYIFSGNKPLLLVKKSIQKGTDRFACTSSLCKET